MISRQKPVRFYFQLSKLYMWDAAGPHLRPHSPVFVRKISTRISVAIEVDCHAQRYASSPQGSISYGDLPTNVGRPAQSSHDTTAKPGARFERKSPRTDDGAVGGIEAGTGLARSSTADAHDEPGRVLTSPRSRRPPLFSRQVGQMLTAPSLQAM
jgi:hypothetical protein